jgi:hypothetical protein
MTANPTPSELAQRVAELPELPEPDDYLSGDDGFNCVGVVDVFVVSKMHSYALAAQDKYAAPLIERITELERQLAETRRVIAADSYAATFQSLGQYRTALLKLLPAAIARSNGQSDQQQNGEV